MPCMAHSVTLYKTMNRNIFHGRLRAHCNATPEKRDFNFTLKRRNVVSFPFSLWFRGQDVHTVDSISYERKRKKAIYMDFSWFATHLRPQMLCLWIIAVGWTVHGLSTEQINHLFCGGRFTDFQSRERITRLHYSRIPQMGSIEGLGDMEIKEHRVVWKQLGPKRVLASLIHNKLLFTNGTFSNFKQQRRTCMAYGCRGLEQRMDSCPINTSSLKVASWQSDSIRI